MNSSQHLEGLTPPNQKEAPAGPGFPWRIPREALALARHLGDPDLVASALGSLELVQLIREDSEEMSWWVAVRFRRILVLVVCSGV